MASSADQPSFEALAQRLRKSFDAEPRLMRGADALPPSRAEVERCLDDILAFVFPGYHGLRRAKDTTETMLAAKLIELSRHMSTLITRVCGDCHADWADLQTGDFLGALPRIRQLISLDVQAALDGDPSCHDEAEAILCLPGVQAVAVHRLAHQLLRQGIPLIPRVMSTIAYDRSGIDIHPAARVGRSFFVDHGAGVVIGETSSIGDHCKIYQGVTLGAKSFRKDDKGRIEREPKRHPTLEDHVVVYAGATILGGDTIVGTGCAVAGGVFLTESVPPGHLVYGPKPEMKLRANPDRPPVSFSI